MSEIHITRAVYQDTKETVSIDAVESGLLVRLSRILKLHCPIVLTLLKVP